MGSGYEALGRAPRCDDNGSPLLGAVVYLR